MTPAGSVSVLNPFCCNPTLGPIFTSLIQSSDGNFYGNSEDLLFQMSPSGIVTPLQHPDGFLVGPVLHGHDGGLYAMNSNNELFRAGNPASCDAGSTLADIGGTFHLGFTLKSQTPATWSTWMVIQGQVVKLWASVAVPVVDPAVFLDIPIPGFPHLGQVVVLTTLTTVLVCVSTGRQ